MRNNVVIYVALFPIVLAIGLGLFLPGMQGMKLKVAADRNIDSKVIEALGNYAEVELFDGHNKVRDRVERSDDLAGIVKDGGKYVVLLEGNESGEAEEVASSLMNMILSDKPKAQYEHVSLGKESSAIREILGSLLLLTAVLVGGMMVGMGIVDEKESKAIRALAVSPLRLFEYLASHLAICLITGIVLGAVSSFIYAGSVLDYWKVTAAIAAASGVSIIIGYIVGGLSDNLISSIAVIKVLMLFVLGVPMGSLFVPEAIQWVFYPFPNYWAFQSFRSIFSGGSHFIGFETACLAGLGLSVAAMAVLMPTLKKRLQLR